MAVRSIQTASTQSVPSGLDLGAIKSTVAAAVGAQDDPDEVQATTAIRLGLTWLLELDWEWYRTSTTITTAAGTATYALPVRTADVHHLRVSSSDGRPIRFVRRDLYDSVIWDQTSNSRFTHYTLEKMGPQNQIVFLPTPDAAETVQLEIFRDPARPTQDSAVVDIAEYMELPLVLYAQALVGQWRGKPQSWVNTQFALADEARRGAQARENHYDEDVRVVPHEEHMVPAASLDVAPSYFERFE